jgi:hypothetical protein
VLYASCWWGPSKLTWGIGKVNQDGLQQLNLPEALAGVLGGELMREEKLGSGLGRLLATAGWLLGGKALGLPVHESLTMTLETTRLQEEVTRLRQALAEERRQRQASEQATTLARQKVVGELRSTPLGVLGLLPGADLEVAEAGYRTLARRHHPDRGGNPDLMRRLNWAIQEIREGRG